MNRILSTLAVVVGLIGACSRETGNAPPLPAAINTRISCHEWFEMNSADQANAAVAAGTQAQAEYERSSSRKVVVLPGDYVALAEMFTAFCKSGATDDLYTAAKKTMAVAFANH